MSARSQHRLSDIDREVIAEQNRRIVDTIEHVEIASLMRRHGAWLVVLNENTDLTEHLGPLDLVDAASSLVAAKRLARASARDLEFSGPFSWEPTSTGWTLHGTIRSETGEHDDESDL